MKLEFAYDAQHRRIAKVVKEWAGGAATGGFTNVVKDRRYVYDGWNMIAESSRGTEARWTDGAAGCPAGVRARAERPKQLDHTTATGTGLAGASVVRTQVWGEDLSGTMQGAGGVGGLLAVRHGGQTFVPLMDGNGNVMGLQGLGGAKDGQTVARYDYDAFGNRITNTAPELGEEVNPFGFSTKFTDEETGLVYYGYRIYLPEVGRWLNRDPITELSFQMLTKGRHRAQPRDEWNLYGFVANDPVNNLDVLGLHEFKNCSASQQGIINRAVGGAKGIVSRSLTNLGGISSEATATTSYKRWFGGYTKSSHRRVKRVYTRVQKQLNGNITFDCCCNMPGVYAYVKVPDFKLKVWLCDEFWKAPASGRDSQPGTIIHELSHESWFSGTDDLAYGEEDADALPTNQAINNADSYQYFAEDQ